MCRRILTSVDSRAGASQGSSRPWKRAPHPRRQYRGNGEDSELEQECAAAFAKFDQAVAAMGKLRTLEQRRAMTIKLGAMADDCIARMQARDEATDLHPQHIELRRIEVFRLMMYGFCSPCQWSKDEVWKHVVLRNVDDDDADQDRT
jgi:hypothetical protein